MRVEAIIRHGKKDLHTYDAAKAWNERGEDELIRASIILRRLNGDSPTRVWREHRGLTQGQLAAASGVSRAMIAAIEVGRKVGSTSSLKKLAATLSCELGSLV